MPLKRGPFCVFFLYMWAHYAAAQVDENEIGGWYTYAWNASLPERPFGFQGDVQYRNWDHFGDLEQLLLRGGITFRINDGRALYTAGIAHITSGAFGSSSATVSERRVYQEALLPAQVGRKVFLTHRFRFEQRWVDGQDFRTRARYFFGLNVPFNQDTLGQGATYLSFYNELFLNLETDIGNGRQVDHFDRNRAYLAIGRSLRDNVRMQIGYMFQKTDNVGKGQIQVNFFQTF